MSMHNEFLSNINIFKKKFDILIKMFMNIYQGSPKALYDKKNHAFWGKKAF